jgi:uncharacterized protein YraI
MMRYVKSYFTVWCSLVGLFVLPTLVLGQSTGVSAEAQIRANLRAQADVNSRLLGEIVSGTRYPVVGRSEFYPWVLLGDQITSQPIGWVFQDLVTIYGNLNTVPVSTFTVSNVPIPTGAITQTVAPTETFQLQGVALPTATIAPATSVTGLVTGEINIRFGPGIEYPRIGVGHAGDSYEITARHTQLPWLQIRYPSAPNGYGWVATDLLEIQGDIYTVPAISQTIFNLPTLTPTLPAVQASNLLETTPVAISPQFQALGDQLWGMMLQANFSPETSRLAALFLMNLKTGEAITFGNQIAFSGMSLNKIAILADLYSNLNNPPNLELAVDVANMMVCSENSASNALLSYLGNGDPYQGAASVKTFMEGLGLGNTFMVAPFLVDPNATPEPVRAPTTQADQVRAEPDYSNQMTVDNLGWLLSGVYQCANTGTGPLMSAMPDAFTQGECRQMLDVMSDNNMGQPLLMSAGVPENTRVAHKHGWTADTHGNAGIVFSPGGDYVLVVALHNPTWLDFSESFPLITEISHTVYNYFNPTAPVDKDRDPYIVNVEDCKVAGTPIIDELTSVNYGG